jgi:hypothetical protein
MNGSPTVARADDAHPDNIRVFVCGGAGKQLGHPELGHDGERHRCGRTLTHQTLTNQTLTNQTRRRGMEIYAPDGAIGRPTYSLAPSPAVLTGLRVGVLDNGKPNARLIMSRMAEQLAARTGATVTVVTDKGPGTRPHRAVTTSSLVSRRRSTWSSPGRQIEILHVVECPRLRRVREAGRPRWW